MVKVESKSLDGLRGFAAFHVALGHLLMPDIDLMGECAVTLFFLVSGFVMVIGYGQKEYSDSGGMCGEIVCVQLDKLNNLCTRKKAPQPPGEEHDRDEERSTLVEEISPPGISFPAYSFMVKRCARLAPTYYIASILAIPVCFIFPFSKTAMISRNVLSLFVLTSWMGKFPFNYALWSISTMAFFYVCFPCLIVRLQKIKTVSTLRNLSIRMYTLQCVWAAVVMLFIAFVLESTAFYAHWRLFPVNRLPVFIMGNCLGLMRVLPGVDQDQLPPLIFEKHDGTSPAVLYGLLMLSGVIMSLLLPLRVKVVFRAFIEVTSPILFSDWILELTRAKGEGKHSAVEIFFRSRALQYMGKISMTFYMFHLIVKYYFGIVLYHMRTDWKEPFRLKSVQDAQIPGKFIPIAIIMMLVAGSLFTHFVEMPLHDFIIAKWLGPALKRGDDKIKAERSSANSAYSNTNIEIELQPLMLADESK